MARCVARLIDATDGGIKSTASTSRRSGKRNFARMRRRIQLIFQDPFDRSIRAARVGEAIIEGPMNFGLGRKEALQRARDLLALVASAAGGDRSLPA